MTDGTPPRAAIVGCAGPALLPVERALFRGAGPLGFILFARNCTEPGQFRDLVAELRAAVGRADAPILIDQEGGRVARLGPPHWWRPPPARAIGRLAQDGMETARRASWLHGRLIAEDLAALGITVDCAPVLDLGLPGTHGVIGDRAYGATPGLVAALGRSFCEGLLAGGVLPVIKHVPGHGRAKADSHLELPEVTASRAELEATDFAPFKALADMPWAMTAHVAYRALDGGTAATCAARLIAEIVRGEIGFAGVLVSDDLGMKALSGDFAARTRAALDAGCDLALHCSGDPGEMAAVMGAALRLAPEAVARLAQGEAMRRAALAAAPPFDAEAGRAELDALLRAA